MWGGGHMCVCVRGMCVRAHMGGEACLFVRVCIRHKLELKINTPDFVY